MTPILEFIVRGMPAPQGSKRYVGQSKAGRGIMIESSAKVRPWREAVRYAAVTVGLQAMLDGPLRLDVVFTLPKPASAPKRRQTWPMRKPDLSKLIRSTEDAMTDAGLWRDDAQVVEVMAAKRYPGEGEHALAAPGAWVRVSRVENGHE
jgi:crossover junction endodeoxyribonuclease RusA